MEVKDLENILNSVIRRADEEASSPKCSPSDRLYLKARKDLALNLQSYVGRIIQTKENEEMIQGILAGEKGKVEELPKAVRPPSELEVTILELAEKLKPGDFLPIDGNRVAYLTFSVKLGNLKKAGKIAKDFGLKKLDKSKYAFLRRKVKAEKTHKDKEGKPVGGKGENKKAA